MPPGRPPNGFLTNKDNIDFDYFLATELKCGTVAELEARMSAKEYLYWTRYYAVRQQKAELEELKAKRKRR